VLPPGPAGQLRISPTTQTHPPTLAAQGELDELEREEFFRLKKVQDKKQRDGKLRAQEKAKRAAEAVRSGGGTDQAWRDEPSTNMLAAGQDDVDLIF